MRVADTGGGPYDPDAAGTGTRRSRRRAQPAGGATGNWAGFWRVCPLLPRVLLIGYPLVLIAGYFLKFFTVGEALQLFLLALGGALFLTWMDLWRTGPRPRRAARRTDQHHQDTADPIDPIDPASAPDGSVTAAPWNPVSGTHLLDATDGQGPPPAPVPPASVSPDGRTPDPFPDTQRPDPFPDARPQGPFPDPVPTTLWGAVAQPQDAPGPAGTSSPGPFDPWEGGTRRSTRFGDPDPVDEACPPDRDPAVAAGEATGPAAANDLFTPVSCPPDPGPGHEVPPPQQDWADPYSGRSPSAGPFTEPGGFREADLFSDPDDRPPSAGHRDGLRGGDGAYGEADDDLFGAAGAGQDPGPGYGYGTPPEPEAFPLPDPPRRSRRRRRD